MPGNGYGLLPSHMRQGGDNGVGSLDAMRRYLTEEEMRNMHPEKAIQVARARQFEEYRQSQGKSSGAPADDEEDENAPGDKGEDGQPRKLFFRAMPDLSGPENEEERHFAASWLWRTHAGSALVYGFLTVAIFVFMGVYHWGDGHQIGRFPLETNFLHNVMGNPINEDRQLTHLPFFWILVWIPLVGCIYHYLHTRDHYFEGYFSDNILHHVGSLKYAYLSFAGGLIAINVFVLVGIVDLPFLLVLGVAAAYVFVQLHAVVWQNGKNHKSRLGNLVRARKAAAGVFTETMGVNPDMPDELHSGDTFVNDTANVANQAVYDSARVVADGVGTVNAVIADVTGMVPSDARRAINRILETILPADLVLAPYGSALLLQITLHVFVFLYWISALVNVGWHELPWIANFAAIFYLLPTFLHVTAFVLYFFQIKWFKVYAYHEMMILGCNTVTTTIFVALVFFGSTQYGTIYV